MCSKMDWKYMQFSHYYGTCICVSGRWGRGHPEEYTEAITLGEEKFDPDSQEGKKPRAGQILWIRGLTRLQTQVSGISYSPCIS
jgi:hypothetical protein